MSRRALRTVVAVIAAVITVPIGVLAFEVQTHHAMTRLVLADQDDIAMPCPTTASLQRLVGEIALAMGQKRVSAFVAKGWLDLTRHPDHPVVGIDVFVCTGDVSRGRLIVMGAGMPDEDGRNQERIAYDTEGRARSGTAGPLVEDPAILDMGGLFGLASQAHAHYVLASEVDGNPLTLWTDPSRFAIGWAVPGGPLTFGHQMVSTHVLLALLAAGAGEDALGAFLLGNAIHYLQDAADPLHTVQVGDACIAGKAMRAWSGRMLATFGGWFGDLPGIVGLATQILSNHHLWVEAVWGASAPVAATSGGSMVSWPDDPVQVLPRFEALALATAEGARMDAPDLFDAACDAASPMLGQAGVRLEDNRFDWRAWQGDDADARTRVEDAGRRATRRAMQASREIIEAWTRLLPWAKTPEGRTAIRAYLGRERDQAAIRRDERLRAYMAMHPEGVADSAAPSFPYVGLVLLLIVVAVGWMAWRLARRPRRPSPAE